MEIIEPLGLSVTKAAQVLGVTRPALSALLNGRAALSSDMALRVEKAFGVRMDTLLRMQTAFEIAEARDRESNIKVKRYIAKTTCRPQPRRSSHALNRSWMSSRCAALLYRAAALRHEKPQSLKPGSDAPARQFMVSSLMAGDEHSLLSRSDHRATAHPGAWS